jgi:hypothetical protein
MNVTCGAIRCCCVLCTCAPVTVYSCACVRLCLWVGVMQLGVEAVGAAHASSSETLRALLLLGAARALPAQTAASLAAEG